MTRRILPSIAAAAALVLIVGFLPGCGGNGTSTVSTRYATATVTIVWPKGRSQRSSRVVPAAANYVKVDFFALDKRITTQIAASPGPGGTTKLMFDRLPAADLKVVATAYPDANLVIMPPQGLGTVQATGSTRVITEVNHTKPVVVKMDSTIHSLKVGDTNTALAWVNGTVDLHPISYDGFNGTGNQVITLAAPTNYEFDAHGTDKFDVSATGVVTGRSMGIAPVTVTEIEKNADGSKVITARQNIAVTVLDLAGTYVGTFNRAPRSCGEMDEGADNRPIEIVIAHGLDNTYYANGNLATVSTSFTSISSTILISDDNAPPPFDRTKAASISVRQDLTIVLDGTETPACNLLQHRGAVAYIHAEKRP